MGRLQQSVGDRQTRIVGILQHSGPCTVGHLADILRVSVTTAARDVAELRFDGEIEPVTRIDGAQAYRVMGS